MNDKAYEKYRRERMDHWDRVATRYRPPRDFGVWYHRRLQEIYRRLVPPGQRVVEIGCGKGDLLAALSPSYGVGVDFSPEMVRCASERHPHLHFIQSDVYELNIDEPFDFIILSDLVNDVWDVQALMGQLRRLAVPRSRIILNSYSGVWEYPLAAAEKFGVVRPRLPQNWLTVEDLTNLLHLADFESLSSWPEILWPGPIRPVEQCFNRFLVRFPPFRWLAITNFIVARPSPAVHNRESSPAVSVIVPARNEAGNIRDIIARTPDLGDSTEIVFVEGHSTDGTYEAIEKAMAESPGRRFRLLRQSGKGKGEAVRLGFSEAAGEILMILDADMTVPPEDLPRFVEAIVSGKGEFINGVRLVYPMEKQSMRFLNLLGNKFFSLAFTWLLGQPVKDTLCGTKVLWKRDYERIALNRSRFGDFDPFGDFDLLFGAAALNLKIAEIPVRYRQRTYGATNIQRWKHGWLLLKMVLFAMKKIKFV